MNFKHGVDYVVGFYYDDELGTAAILDVTNDKFFSLPAEYGPPSRSADLNACGDG